MNAKVVLVIFLCLVCHIIRGQKVKSYDFKSVQELPRHKGLQDPFLKSDGNRVVTREEWSEQRKYIRSLLAHYQYGSIPPTPEDVEVDEVLSEDIFDGKATRKLYTLSMRRNGQSLDFHFGLVKPKGPGPFPVIIKNDRQINDIPNEISLEALTRGYIMCQFVRTDLGSDYGGNLDENRDNGVFLLYPEYNWGTIAAWAWGYQLIIDYFEKVDFIDINKIIVTGHSRGGKTAFCAGIFDERIAITAPNSSGLGGTASHRYFELGMDDQTIGHAKLKNAHWWTSTYFELAGLETRIPFDAHFGKAVIAPRGFVNTHALQDYWANPFGTYLTHEAARKVYKWMGVENNIALHWRTGGHEQGIIDWVALLDFSDQYFYHKEVDSRFDIVAYPTIKVPLYWKVPGND